MLSTYIPITVTCLSSFEEIGKVMKIAAIYVSNSRKITY